MQDGTSPTGTHHGGDAPQRSLCRSLFDIVADFMYRGHAEPDDDFVTRVRKATLGVIFLGGVIGLVTLLNDVLTEVPASLSGYLRIAMTLVFVLAAIPAFIYMKVTHRAETWLTDLVFFSLHVNTVLTIIVEPTALIATTVLAIAVILMCTSTPLYPLHYFLLFGQLVCAIINYAHATTGTGLVQIPEPATSTYQERLMGGAVAGMAFLLLPPLVRWLLDEFREQGRNSTATTRAAEVVSKHLARYDTASAHDAVIDAANSSEGAVSPALLVSLRTLVDNLNMYRPHLPNWVLQRTLDEDTEGDLDLEEHEEGDDESFASASTGGSWSRQPGSGRLYTPKSDSPGQKPSTPKRRGSGEEAANISPADELLRGALIRSDIHVAKGAIVVFTYVPLNDDGAPFSLVNPTDAQRAALSNIMHSFTECIYAVAGQVRGAVHSFVGDQVTVTFNAASRVAQPEVKAAQFIARMKKAAGKPDVREVLQHDDEITKLDDRDVAAALAMYNGVSTPADDEPQQAKRKTRAPDALHVARTPEVHLGLCGAACSGSVASMTAGRNASQAFAVMLPFHDRLSALTRYSRRTRSFVLDERTYKAAKFDVVAHGVAALQLNDGPDHAAMGGASSPHAASPPHRQPDPNAADDALVAAVAARTLAFAVIGEVGVANDEWMYVMNKAVGANPHNTVTSALEHCVDGRYGEALACLSNLPDDFAREPLVAQLHERAEYCLRNPDAQFAQ